MVASELTVPHGIKHKGKENPQRVPQPQPPSPTHTLPDPLMLLWLLQSPFRSGQGSNYEAKRIRRGLGVLNPPLPLPQRPLPPARPPSIAQPGGWVGPRPGALRLLVKSCGCGCRRLPARSFTRPPCSGRPPPSGWGAWPAEEQEGSGSFQNLALPSPSCCSLEVRAG